MSDKTLGPYEWTDDFHGTVVLAVGLLAGFAYGQAIVRRAEQRKIEAWRAAHTGLSAGGVMAIVLGLALQLASIWGASRSTPIAGHGFEGQAWQEAAVELLLMGAAGAAIVAAVVVLVSFWQGRHVKEKSNEALEPTG